MPQPITPDHIFDFPTASQPHLSAVGSALVFVKKTIDRLTMERQSYIVVSHSPFTDLSGVTDGPSDSAPVINGGRVLFLRPDENGKKQVWTVPLEGGEARCTTDLPGGVEEFEVSPDGERVAAVSSVDPNNADDSDSGQPSVRVVRRVRYRHDFRGFTGDAFRQLFVIDIELGDTRQVTDGEGDNWSPVWSPDGKAIAFISDDIEGRDFTTHTQVKVVSDSGGQPVTWSESLPYVWAAAWSPDGKSLAAVGCHDPDMWDPRSAWLYVLDASGGVNRITDGLYTPVPECGLSWTDGRGIAFVGAHRGEYFVCSIGPDGSDFKTITSGGVNSESAAFDAAASRAVIVAESPRSPAELVHVDLESGTQRAVTKYSAEYIESHPPARMEKFTIRRGDFEIESRVLLPPDLNDARKYPMVLDIHGGPNGRFSDNFDPVHQVLATNGYIVLSVNPRGSSTYSPEFTKSVLGDWGGEDYLDILASVDEMSARPYVDENRMAVHGFSYGGFMSGWIVGHDHRFKAAVVGAMCANLHSMYGTSDIGTSFGEINWGGPYTGARDKFLHHSPITYAANVQTPVLLLHGEDDLRCPIEQSEQYFVALKRLGKTVEFVRFPESAHRFRKLGHPALIVEYYNRLLEWLERYIGVGTL